MRIDFYHLIGSTVENILPVLAEKVCAQNKRLLIRTDLREQAEHLNAFLWTYKTDSWLPHGMDGEGAESEQPVLISTGTGNANRAETVLLLNGAELSEITGFERCFNLFDGRDESAVQAARVLWKAAMDDGNELYYWQQNDMTGKWEMKASRLPVAKNQE